METFDKAPQPGIQPLQPAILKRQVRSLFDLFLCGLRPLAMLVSADPHQAAALRCALKHSVLPI